MAVHRSKLGSWDHGSGRGDIGDGLGSVDRRRRGRGGIIGFRVSPQSTDLTETKRLYHFLLIEAHWEVYDVDWRVKVKAESLDIDGAPGYTGMQ